MGIEKIEVMSDRKVVVERIKSKLSDEAAPLVDLYAPILLDMTAEQIAAWIGLVAEGKSRLQKEFIAEHMSKEEIALSVRAARIVIVSLGKKYNDRRKATKQMYIMLMNIGLMALSAYLSSFAGVPIVVSYSKPPV